MTDEIVIGQELVIHLFALHDGPESTRSAAAIQAIWESCRDLLDATEPVAGLPTDFLVDRPAGPRGEVRAVAAMRRPDDLAEVVMRHDDDMFVLSLLLATGLAPAWRDLRARLGAVLDNGLLGVCLLYLGKYPEVGGEPSAEYGRAVAKLLPESDYPGGWWHEGVRTGIGLGLWEPTRDVSVDEREFVILADPTPAGDEALTRWAWRLPGTTQIPPFARYLMHVAKIRYQLRVMSDFPMAQEFTRLREAGPDAAAAITETARRLRAMRRAVDVSWLNAMRALEPTGWTPSLDGREPFGRDADLVRWLRDQLALDAAAWEERGSTGSGTGGLTPLVQGRPMRLLLVADEWFPARGGVSQLNRALCIALAESGAEVTCVLPQADRRERSDATGHGVRLAVSDVLYAQLNGARATTEPLLPAADPPDVVVGHSRFTGPAARNFVRWHCPRAVLVHIIHMVADDIEGSKGGSDPSRTAEQRKDEEVELGSSAQVVVSVGPVLHKWSIREMAQSRPVLHQLDPGFDTLMTGDREVPPGDPKIMIMGRTRDHKNKGIDLACRAISRAAWLTSYRTRWDLLVRGVPEGEATDFTGQLRDWTAGARSVHIIPPRYFSTNPGQVQRDLLTSSLLTMASRAEGYGLVGHEAVVAGTPLLASARSGLGVLLAHHLPDELRHLVVIPVEMNDQRDIDRWGHYIGAVLENRPAAFQTAAEVRRFMARTLTWDMAASRLLEVLCPLVAA